MPSSSVDIVAATAVDDELVEAFQRLIPQLSSSSPPPTRDLLSDLVGSPMTSIIGNFFLRVTRPAYRTRLFTDEGVGRKPGRGGDRDRGPLMMEVLTLPIQKTSTWTTLPSPRLT